MNWEAIVLTAKLATIVSVVLLAIGLPLAYWLAFTRSRLKFVLEPLIALPLVLPPTVLGFYLLLAFGGASPAGRFYQSLTGHGFAFSFSGLVLASVLYSLPFAVQPFASAFSAVDRKLLAAATVLGVSRWRALTRILLPLSLPGIVTGVVLSFAHTVGEFGVVLMVGGNIPGITRTVSIDIYDNVQEFNFALAHRTALVLLLFSFAALTAVYALHRRVSVPLYAE